MLKYKFNHFLDFLNPYYHILKLREILYKKGIFSKCRFSIPVISIGNINLGGTGKTTYTRTLGEFFLKKGKKVAIVLRGYKRTTKGPKIVFLKGKILLNLWESGDDAYLYAKYFHKFLEEKEKFNLVVAVGENRCEAVRLVLNHFQPDIILLDDGFQHLKIHRDLDIVLLSARDLKERLLPFGRLREPLEVLERRGDFLLLKEETKELKEFIQALEKPYGEFKIKKIKLLDSNHLEVISWENLKNKRFIAVAGLGDNIGFFNLVKSLSRQWNFTIEKFYDFPDHYNYSRFIPTENLPILTTLKDVFKLLYWNRISQEIYVIDREIEIDKRLLEILNQLLRDMTPSIS